VSARLVNERTAVIGRGNGKQKERRRVGQKSDAAAASSRGSGRQE
jgi:hypothetical protein